MPRSFDPIGARLPVSHNALERISPIPPRLDLPSLVELIDQWGQAFEKYGIPAIKELTGIDLSGVAGLLDAIKDAIHLDLSALAELNPVLFLQQIDDALNGIDLSGGPGAVLEAIGDAVADLPAIRDALQVISVLFDGVDFSVSHAPEEVWEAVVSAFIRPLNTFAELIGGLLPGSTIPTLDASKIGSGTLDKLLFPDVTRDMSSDIQGTIDAAVNAIRNTTGAVGQGFSELESAWAQIPTALFNKFGGNNEARASGDQAADAMTMFADTLGRQGIAISELKGLLESGDGFNEAITFRAPETKTFSTPGSFEYTLPSWFNTVTDSLDAIALGAGGGGGGGLTDPSGAGTDTVFRMAGVDKALGVGGASVGSGTGAHPKGWSPGNLTYLDILYQGGGEANVQATGSPPGGGGGAGDFFGVQGKGGIAGAWDTETLGPGTVSGALTGVVGTGGQGTSTGFGAADGAPGRCWIRARPAMPAAFTSMGTLLLPTFRLNTGVALTDAQTSWATWSRIPPGGAAGGHILVLRANTSFTSYVYLWIKVIDGVTNYEVGRVVSSVKATPWLTGTIGAAVPFNAFSLTSDDDYTFTVAINGNPFDSYQDLAHASMKGEDYRSGGWASSDDALPGSIQHYSFLDSGIPSRITSNTVATSQSTNSTTFANLTTIGPSVTITVPASGEVSVTVAAYLTTGAANQSAYMGFDMSGVNTAVATDPRSAVAAATGQLAGGIVGTIMRTFHLTGLNPGTTTFTTKFRTSSSTATFAERTIIVEPKP